MDKIPLEDACKMVSFKLIGYLVAGIGLIGMALSTGLGAEFIGEDLASVLFIPAATATLAGIILLMFSSKGASGKGKQVPVYKGKKIVGYRVVEGDKVYK